MSSRGYQAVRICRCVGVAIFGKCLLTVLVFRVACSPFRHETDIVTIEAVQGETVQLKCPVSHEVFYSNDSGVAAAALVTNAELVLWYHNQAPVPIAVYDARELVISASTHSLTTNSANTGPLEGECKKRFCVSAGHLTWLTVARASTADSGLYMCSVQRQRLGTRVAYVRLNVIVPAGMPLILNSNMIRVGELMLREGESPRLMCLVSRGSPLPRLVWKIGSEVVDTSFSSDIVGVVTNNLTTLAVRRHHADKTLSCEATNSRLAPSTRASLRLHLLLPPIQVTITLPNHVVSHGRNISVICRERGSRPAAQLSWRIDAASSGVTWWKTSGTFTSSGNLSSVAERTVSSSGSVSRIDLTVSKQRRLPVVVACSAHNPVLSNSKPVTARQRIDVHYLPSVKIRFGRGISEKQLDEGDDVLFTCLADSNPTPDRIDFYHETSKLLSAANILVSGNHLVIRDVSPSSQGQYRCSASNLLGSAFSQRLKLQLLYTPRCEHGIRTVFFVPRLSFTLRCRLRARPDTVRFQWSISRLVNDSQPLYTHRDISRDVSLLSHVLGGDLALVTCSGSNAVGPAQLPCVFRLRAADLPDPLSQCRVVNTSRLTVKCLAGHDGGIPQRFGIEIWRNDEPALLHNWTSAVPMFEIDLAMTTHQSDLNCTLVMYAHNARGRGPASHVLLGVQRVSVGRVEKSHRSVSSLRQVSAEVMVAATVLLAALLVCSVLVTVRRRRLSLARSLHHSASAADSTAAACRMTRSPPAHSGTTSACDL